MNPYKAILAKHRRQEAAFIRQLRISMYVPSELPPQPSELKLVLNAILPTLGLIFLVALWLVAGCAGEATAEEYTPEQYCQAIYIIEGGAKTKHPYGILTKYKNTTPKQACLNTVNHKHKDWVTQGSHGSFTNYLGSKYCPINSDTDDGTCVNWIPNLKFYLAKDKK